MLPVVLITADQIRHRWVARELSRSMHLVGIVSEGKAAELTPPDPVSGDARVIARHLAERDVVERELLGDDDFPQTEILRIETGSVNAEVVCNWIETRQPELAVLYGTGVIRNPLLELLSGRLINIHLGLSPYYRGAGTNFWPLVHGEPECVGTTVHVVAPRVDAGAILAQVRPAMQPSDRAHEIGTKALRAAVEILPDVLRLYRDGRLAGRAQDLSAGRVFRRRDFNADAVRQLWTNLDGGMIPTFLADAAPRLAKFPIHEFAGSRSMALGTA
jgi:folate-dependent phosphoribosylglycinamide formyltransferase PurN